MITGTLIEKVSNWKLEKNSKGTKAAIDKEFARKSLAFNSYRFGELHCFLKSF